MLDSAFFQIVMRCNINFVRTTVCKGYEVHWLIEDREGMKGNDVHDHCTGFVMETQ